MIEVKGLYFSYSKKPFLENINFSVGEGEIFGILVPYGAGKSTLQKILTALITNYMGEVRVNGVDSKQHVNSFYEHFLVWIMSFPPFMKNYSKTEFTIFRFPI